MRGRIKIILFIAFMAGGNILTFACGISFKNQAYVDYNRLSSPLENIAILPFESKEEQNKFLTERLRRDFYSALVHKGYPTFYLSDVDRNLAGLYLRTGKKLENLSPGQLIEGLGTDLIAVGELTELSNLYLLFYSQVKASGRFWLIDYKSGEKFFYNEVSATNKRFSPPTGLFSLATSGLDTAAHLSGTQTVTTIRALGERAVDPLPEHRLLKQTGERVEKIKVNVASPKLKMGDIVEVEAWGPTGRKAWFDIGPRVQRVPLQEKAPGYYWGRYVINPGDNVEQGLVRVGMSSADGKEVFGAVNFDTPLIIDAVPPPPPSLTEFRTTKKTLMLKFSSFPKPKDLSRIFIYRGIERQQKIDRFYLIGSIAEGESYIDEDIQPATTFVYYAIVVDQFGNSSGAGEPFRITLPQRGPTLLRGKFSKDMVLMRYASPFFIDSQIVMENGATLTIEPGVEIYFSPAGGIYLNDGRLKATGTAEEKIYLYPSEAQWAGISVSANKQNYVSLGNVIINKAIKGIEMLGGNVSLSRVEFKRCSIGLELAQAVSCWLYQCQFIKNSVAILNAAEKLTIHHNDFIKNTENIKARKTKVDLLPERKRYDFTAYISGESLLPPRSIR